MSDFESFLSDQRDQATAPPAGALVPATDAPPAAAAPQDAPDSSFEGFLKRARGATQQQAQATTVVNSTQSTDTAAKAAPIARQLGMPQAAVETDLPRFQQQAKLDGNSAVLSQNPVLASWVAANPDSARIAQDEYHQLATIEQSFGAGTDSIGKVGYAALQGLGGAYNAAALGMNRQIGALTSLLGPQNAADWWYQHMVAPRVAAQGAFASGPGIGERTASMMGGLLGMLSQITMTGGAGGVEAPASASALETVGQAGATAVRSMAFPAVTAATNKGAEVYDATGDTGAAARAAAAEYFFNTAQGIIPFSAPGGLVRRMVTGAASSVATSEGQRSAMNLLLPDTLRQDFNVQEALFQAMTGAVLGGVMGPRGEPDYTAAIRKTYTDAVKAEQAQRDIGKVQALGEISAQSKLREADPTAFHQFVQAVSDKGDLDAVYIRPADLQAALAQSPVDLRQTLPDLVRQMGEGAATGADVRIPVADYATHIAGTDLEKALLPSLKAAPDGMTFKEGQAFYQDAVKNLQEKAGQIASLHVEQTGQEADRQAVHQQVYQQLISAGRTPDVANTEAALHEAFYTTLGERMGVKPSEAMAKFPVRLASEPLVGESLKQGDVLHLGDLAAFERASSPTQNNASGESAASVEAINRVAQEKAQDRPRYVIDTRYGQVRPLTGVDSVDHAPAAHEIIVQKNVGKDEWSVLSSGQSVSRPGVEAAVNRARSEGVLHQGQRGGYLPDTHTIALLKDADLTTFAHESGHHFLEVMREAVSSDKAPADMKADFDALLRHFKVEGATPEERLANWSAKGLEDQRAGHETFAQSFEKYLMEGKAPSFELQPMFSRFRSWLLNVYKSLRGLNVELTPEVRGVFDRMLASDQAIKETETARAYMPLWKTAAEAGMTPEQFKAYVQLGDQASAHALDAMQARSLADLKWASNAKSKALKSLQREADAARREVQGEVAKEVDAMPIFQLKDHLAGIKNYDPDIVAQSNGFEDAHHMQQAIEQAGSKKDVIATLTDQRMLERYGEMLDPQAIEQAANDAVHNEARARFMATGLKVLTDSPLPAAQIAKAAKEAAEGAISGKRIMDIDPRSYLASETRANRDAVAAAGKDPQAAIEAQRAAVLSNRLAKASQDAMTEVRKGLDFLKKFDSPTVAAKVGGDYMDRINELLSNYDVTNRFNTANAMEARQDMRAWLQGEFTRTGVMPEVSDGLMDFARRRHWKELSVEEFRGLVDSVKSLEHVGRAQQEVLVAGKKVALADMVQRVQADLADMPHNQPVDIQPDLAHAKGLDKIAAQFLSLKSKVRGMDAALIKMEQLFQWLTYGRRSGLGDTRSGPFLEMFQRAADAEGTERTLRAQSAADMRRLGEQLRDAGVNLNEKLQLPLQRPGRGGQWYREELIAAALNTGNAGNLEKLTKGYGWDQRALMSTLDANLSKAEWQFVQGTWDAIGKYGPQIEALQKRMTGVAPKMVDPVTVHTQHGDFQGGYYPVVYDSFLDRSIEQKYARNADALFENMWATPTTSKGHTIARTGYTGPIQLSLGVIPRHLDQVTHDLAFREAVVDINKFLSHPVVQGEVDQVMGREYTRQFRPWLQAMANDKVFNTAGDTAWESFYRKTRTNATLVGLGFRLSTMLIHGGSALSNSIGEIGSGWMAKGAAQFATPERWEASKQFMYDRSPEMANRFNEFDRNINEAIRQINKHEQSLGPVSATQKTVDGARRFAYYGVQALDMGSAAPTWMGAYLKGMAPEAKGGLGLSEDAAIDLANRAVRNAHGGGGVKDLSAVQRDKGVMSLATMFYSYWSHMYNRQRDIARGFGNLPQSFQDGTGTQDFAKLLARSWWYFVVPQVIHALLKPAPQDQEDTLAGHALHFGEEIALGFVSGVPVLRDLANAAVNGRDYSITPLEQAGKSIVKATVDTAKFVKGDETSPHAGKNALLAGGYLFGLPTGQLATAQPFLWDVYSGDAAPQDIKDWYDGVSSGRMKN